MMELQYGTNCYVLVRILYKVHIIYAVKPQISSLRHIFVRLKSCRRETRVQLKVEDSIPIYNSQTFYILEQDL